jgi:nucleotide-binding universal stress UspA family protein
MFSKILCPSDLSKASLTAVRYAAELARKCKSKLYLLNVHEEFLNKQEMVMLRVSAEHFQEMMSKRAVESKKIMEQELRIVDGEDLDYELIIREGKPTKAIIEIAEELGVDLIVITTNGRDSLGEKILGSTAEHIIRYSKVPVLTIRV